MASDYLQRWDVQGHLKVKESLRKWDPIGVFDFEENDWPEDEYDAYSGPVVGLQDRVMSGSRAMAFRFDDSSRGRSLPGSDTWAANGDQRTSP